MTPSYPGRGQDRNRWILQHRTERNALDPSKPYAFLIEEERAESGEVVSVATVFLTNRECPWRCLMCDLWKNTLTETVLPGAIPTQINHALSRLAVASANRRRDSAAEPACASGGGAQSVPVRMGAAPRQIKLYNSGSFFDPHAIPPEDYAAIARQAQPFERVIVECHPALVGDACLRFRDLLAAADATPRADTAFEASGLAGAPAQNGGHETKLEVAMGLETAHPEVLEKLNKRMTLDQFARAADFLARNDIALRVFILAKPPFLDEAEAAHWAKRSLDFAFDCGATVASLIPTRFGNGALEALAQQGQFSPPKLSTLEAAAAYGIGLRRGRVFADLWDLGKFSDCPHCLEPRQARLRVMNLQQIVPPAYACPRCRAGQ